MNQVKIMNLSSTTLILMRQSAGAVLAAAAISGEARAEDAVANVVHIDAACSLPAQFESDMRTPNAEEPKKDDAEKK